MPNIRIVLVEAQPIFMQGIVENLQSADDIEIVATVTSGREGIATIREHEPDVAVIGIELPDISGLIVLEEIGRNHTAVICLTSYESQDMIFDAMQKGARGYLLKWNNEIELVDAIRQVAEGKPAMGSTSLNSLLAALAGRDWKKRKPVLSDREREVLTLISQGMSQVDVARHLKLAHTTIRTHCRTAYVKLDVKTQGAAVREALRRGLIDDTSHPSGARTSPRGRGARGRSS